MEFTFFVTAAIKAVSVLLLLGGVRKRTHTWKGSQLDRKKKERRRRHIWNGLHARLMETPYNFSLVAKHTCLKRNEEA